MNSIFHITTMQAWKKAKKLGQYQHESLESEGFIHCSCIGQVSSVLQTYFSDSDDDLVLLCIDEDKVDGGIIYEGDTPILYPHIYGELNTNSVIEAIELQRNKDGSWQVPPRAKQMARFIELRTPRLILREIEPLDWEDIHAYASQSQVVQYQLWGPNSEMDSLEFVNEAIESQRAQPRMDYYIGIIHKDENKLIGACNLTYESERHRSAEFGYVIHPKYWRQGFATEAVTGLMQLGFSHLQLHRMSATCDERNKASANVLEKCGCTLEGRLRENFWLRGKWRNSLMYGILKQEWRSHRRKTL